MVVDISTLKRISTVARELGVTDQAVRQAANNGKPVKGIVYTLVLIDGMKFIRER